MYFAKIDRFLGVKNCLIKLFIVKIIVGQFVIIGNAICILFGLRIQKRGKKTNNNKKTVFHVWQCFYNEPYFLLILKIKSINLDE
ncbi:hypothetical protein D9M73_284170 [compost metagenome]